jgi:hypothetical protein
MEAMCREFTRLGLLPQEGWVWALPRAWLSV